jgi:NhaA family Na+:H+ antiporter
MPRSPRRVPVLTPLVEFLRTEAAGGAVLLAAAGAALVWANVAGASYHDVWTTTLRVGTGRAAIELDLQHWVNDGLMAVFFFVVGLEIKRELVEGELRDPRTAALPAIAALGGMVVPALLYLAWTAGTPARDGWGIPMATDIAFAVGVLTLLGSRVSSAVKLFVLTLAIVDDIGAIIVIALFYSDGIDLRWLFGALLVVVATVLARRVTSNLLAYVPLALALWVCTYQSGVHATLAGVALGLLTPTRARDGSRPLDRLEHRLHPVASFAVIPLFALANAGIVVSAGALSDAFGSRVTWAVLTGLVVGKLVGVAGATLLGARLGVGRLPSGMTVRELFGAGVVAGIGFTVSLFIADLAFSGQEAVLNDTKIGVLVASVVAGAAAFAVLARSGSRRVPEEPSRT